MDKYGSMKYLSINNSIGTQININIQSIYMSSIRTNQFGQRDLVNPQI